MRSSSSYPSIRHDTPLVVCVSFGNSLSIPLPFAPCPLRLVPSHTAPSDSYRVVGNKGGRGRGRFGARRWKHPHSSVVCCLSRPTASHHIKNTSRCLSASLLPRSLIQSRRQGVRRRERRVSNDQSCPLSLSVARVIPSARGVDRVTNPKM